jgi:hypothetical protein
MIFAVTELYKNIKKKSSLVNLPMHLKIMRFSITSLHLLIRETFATRPSVNVAKKNNRIIKNVLNETTTNSLGAQTQVPASSLRIIHQSC